MPKNTIAKETVHLVAAKTCLSCGREFAANSEHAICPDDLTMLCPSVIDSDIGICVGNYELVSKIGEGSSGQVYIATHTTTGGQAAAKLLKLNLLSDPSAVRRFQQEAEAISSLVHPNITSIYEFGVLPDGRPFIIMEYAGPTTLADVLNQQGSFEFKQANKIFLQIVDALKAAHNAGILHRDIKPSNIIIDDQNNVKVIDFGIAKINGIETTVTMTRTGATVGTPAYMSPEQCLGGKLDARSDIYSLGCLMFECLSGKKVFASENAFLCMNQHSFDDAPLLSKLVKGLPELLMSAVMICLHKSPEHRFQSMSELKSVLAAVSDKQLKTRMTAHSTLLRNFLRRSKRSSVGNVPQEPGFNSRSTVEWTAAGLVALATIAAIVYFEMPQQQSKKFVVPASSKPPATIFPEAQKPDPDTIRLNKQFVDIQKEVVRLKTVNQNSAAEKMSAELKRYQNMMSTGKLAGPAYSGTEVHSITAQKGYGGIGSYRYGKPLPGTTIVDVSYSSNPIILTLNAEQPVHWTINTAPGVKVKQVILTGPEPRSVNKPQAETKITVNKPDHDDNEVYLPYAARPDDLNFERVAKIANKQLGANLVTVQSSEDSRSSIVVGTESTRWRAQYVRWLMQDFYKRCMKSRDELIADSLRKLTFDGALLTTEFLAPAKEIGSFSPYGPKNSTFKKIDNMVFFDAISVINPESGKKLWYLLSDGRDGDPNQPVLGKYDPDQNKLTKLFGTNDPNNRVWWSYRSITYDTMRNMLIILAPAEEVPFLKFDLGKGTLSPYGNTLPHGTELYAISYNPEDDTTYAIATDLLESPYHMYLCQFRDGVLKKFTPLSKDFFDVQTLSMCKMQLRSSGEYVIAVVGNEHISPDDVNYHGPTCAVIERSTGKVVYSGEMKR